jgi:hypothetical protein
MTGAGAQMKFNATRRKRFLELLARTGNVTRSAAAVGVARQNIYAAREVDPEFRRAWDEAIDAGMDDLEGEVLRRARDGIPEPVVSGGRVVTVPDPENPNGPLVPLMVRKYSDTLAVTLLKAHRPEKYRDRSAVEHTGKGGGPIQHRDVDAKQVILGELARIRGRLLRAAAGDADSTAAGGVAGEAVVGEAQEPAL